MTSLTVKQRAVLGYIIVYQSARGKPPTVREMMDYFGWRSPNSVATHLAQLEAKGYIRRHPGESRNVEILNRCTIGNGQPKKV